MTPRLLWLEDDPAAAVAAARVALQAQQAIAFPTDTVYGLLAAHDSPWAYQQIYVFKRRDRGKPLALLVAAGSAMAQQVELALRAYPGPLAEFRRGSLTVVLPENDLPAAPDAVHSLQPGPVGLRCPAFPALQALLQDVGGLLWATSLNLAGEPPLADSAAVEAWLSGRQHLPALTVLSRSPLHGSPSRVALLERGRMTDLR